MGNRHSGRWEGHQPHDLTENYLCIDVRDWQRLRKIFASNSFDWFLYNPYGEPQGYVKVTVPGSYLDVQYYDMDGLKVDHLLATIRLTWTDSRFGAKVWFLCPECMRRVRILYLEHAGVQCRKCYRLAYKSQRRNLCK